MSSLLFLLLLHLVPANIPISTTAAPIHVQLTHRDSNRSPLYNPNETQWDRQERLNRISDARLASYYYQAAQKNRYDDVAAAAVYSAPLVPTDNGLLFVSFGIGERPVQLLAFMDIGSSLLWVECRSTGNKQTSTLYNPNWSSTRRYLTCDDPACMKVPYRSCPRLRDRCIYEQTYGDQSVSTGFLTTEQFVFQNSSLVWKDVVFGCSLTYSNQAKPLDHRFSGLFALGAGPLSPVKDQVFSVCLGDAKDRNYEFHHLVLMDDMNEVLEKSTLHLTVTDLKTNANHYIVQLYSIKMEDDGEDLIPMVRNHVDVILDTGSITSYFPVDILYPLRYQLDKVIWEVNPNTMKMADEAEDQWCYRGVVEDFNSDQLKLILYFPGSAKIVWRFDSILYQVLETKVCLSLRSSTKVGNASLIGLLGLQNHKLTFDAMHGSLYMDPDFPCEQMGE